MPTWYDKAQSDTLLSGKATPAQITTAINNLATSYVSFGPTAPDPTKSTVWIDTTTIPQVVKGYNGSTWVAIGGGAVAVTSVAGRTGAVTLTKSDVALSNVDNTSDANKPVSTAQAAAITAAVNSLVNGAPGALDQLNELAAALGNDSNFAATVTNALALKASLASPTFTGTVSGITKTMVGLGNVDNTADAAKPISTAQQTALDAKASLASPTFTGTPKIGADPIAKTTDIATTGSGFFQRPTVVVPAATGVAATDQAALAAAVAACADGGRIYIPFGVYALNDALVITKRLTIEGDAATSTFVNATNAGDPNTPYAPYVKGSVLKQTIAGKHILDIQVSGGSVNLARLGLVFADGLASTGNAVNAIPTQTTGSGKDFGLVDFHWTNVYVAGHDGNHYAFTLLNPMYGTLTHLRSWGGGGIQVENDTGSINAGNLVVIGPFFHIINVGTAHGIAHKSAVTFGLPGQLNLMSYLRPQVTMIESVRNAGTQLPWTDFVGAGQPRFVTCYDPDFEGLGNGNQPAWGPYTTVVGNGLVDGGNSRDQSGVRLGQHAGAAFAWSEGSFTAVGFSALAAATTGAHNTGVGYRVLESCTTNGDNTGVGFQALQNVTGEQNTALGSTSMQGASGSTAAYNTAFGQRTMQYITSGQFNNAIGFSALNLLTYGVNNVALGSNASFYSNNSTANAIITGNDNVHIGANSGSYAGDISQSIAIGTRAYTAQNATAIGDEAQARANGSVAIGRDNTGAAAQAILANDFMLGTGLHTVKVPSGNLQLGSDPLLPRTTVLTADQTNSNATANTMQDVTGLSFPVFAGTYQFRALIRFTAAATTTGSRWSINGPTASLMAYRSQYSLTTTSETVNNGQNAYNLPAAASASSAGTDGNIAMIEGIVTLSASGTVIVRFASEVASSAIVAKAGSFITWQKLA